MFFHSDHLTLISSIEAIGASFAVFEFDQQSLEFTLISCNSRYEELIGKKNTEVIEKSLVDVFPKYIYNPLQKLFTRCKNERISFETEFCIDYKGQERYWRSILSPIIHAQNEKFRVIQTCVEITDKKILEQKLNLSLQRFEAVVNNAYDGIITIDEDQNIKLFNEAAQSMFGYKIEELIGKPLTNLIPKKYRNKHTEYVKGFKKSPISSRAMQTRASVQGLRKDGSNFPIEVTISKIKVDDNIEFTAVIRDTSEKNNLLEELLLSSRQDPLTNLNNRRYFLELLESEVIRSKRFKRDYSLLMLDIDYFKLINDKFGHLCGDKALIAFSNILIENVREVDVVCRWGGEEFMVLLPEISKENALTVAEKIRRSIESLEINDKGILINMTVSIGLQCFSGEDVNIQQMIDTVDKCLYKAKKSGRNRVSIEV